MAGEYASLLPQYSKPQLESKLLTPAHEELLGAQYPQAELQSVSAGLTQPPGTLDYSQWKAQYVTPEFINANKLGVVAKAGGNVLDSRLQPLYGTYKQQQLNAYTTQLANMANTAAQPGTGSAGTIGGTGASSVTNPYMTAAAQQYQQLIDESNAVSGRTEGLMQEAQGQLDEMPAAWGEREQNLTQYLEGLGQSQRDELARQEEAAQSGLQQDMINRGMISTSVMDSLRGGIRSGFQQNRASLEDTLTREKMDYRGGLSSETLGARERAIGGAKDTARSAWEMQQSPLAARQAYADALAKQREFDLVQANQLQQERMRMALGYADLRVREAQGYQDTQTAENQMRNQSFINQQQLLNNELMQRMQMSPTSYYQNYQLSPQYGGKPHVVGAA